MKGLSVFLYVFSIILIVICVVSQWSLLISAANGNTSHQKVFFVSLLHAFAIAGCIAICQVAWQIWKEADRREKPYSSQYRWETPPEWLRRVK